MKTLSLFVPLTLLLVAMIGGSSASAAPKQPNILWLAGENLAHDLGCYGAQNVRTPHLDRLAAEGVRYTHVIATNPTCAPSRSAFFTGMYQTSTDTHPMRSHRTDAYRLPEGVRPVTHRLRDAGYFTANLKTLDGKEIGTGKLDLNFVNEGPIYHENSSDWSALPKDRPFFAVVNAMESEYDIYDRQTWKQARAEWVGEREHEKIATPQNVTPPPYYPDHPVVREEWARYLNSVSGMDKRFGVVLDKLRAEGREDDTVIIFFGDNGRLEPRGIHWCYDSGLRVPLIIRWPKNFPAPARYAPGTVNDEIVSLLDLTATTLAAAGVPRPLLMQSHSLIGERTTPPRSYAFAARDRIDETEQRIRSVHDARYHYIRTLSTGPTFASLNRYKEKCFPIYPLMRQLLAEGKLTGPPLELMQRTGPSEELYDLRSDPHEIHNLADSARPEHREARASLRAALDTWMIETGDRGHIPEPREVVAPFAKEMHDWFGTPAWAQPGGAKTASVPSSDALTLAAVLRDEAALTGAHDIEIRDGIAYIAGKGYTTRALPSSGVFPYEKGKGGSLAVVDVRQPASPKLLWAAKNPLAYEDAETVLPLSGNRLLVGTRDLFLFDVTAPAVPKQLFAIKDRPRVDITNGFARLGDVVFGANKEGYIYAVNAAFPERLTLLGARNARQLDGLEKPHDAAFRGDLLVIVAPEGFGAESRPGKLAVYRVADPRTHKALPPEQWALVGKLEHPRLAGANRVMIRGNFAYAGCSLVQKPGRTDKLWQNVSVIDLTDPAQPTLRGSIDFPGSLDGPNGLEVAGEVAYAAGGQTVLAIDVANPDAPRELGRFTSTSAFPGGRDDAHDLVYHDGHLFVTAQNSHALVILKVGEELRRRSQ